MKQEITTYRLLWISFQSHQYLDVYSDFYSRANIQKKLFKQHTTSFLRLTHIVIWYLNQHLD